MNAHTADRAELFALELEREWPEVSPMLHAYAALLAANEQWREGE